MHSSVRHIIIAVVGTGFRWEMTEVGMLSTGLPKVNLQYEVKDAQQRLVSAVKKHLPDDDGDERLKPPSPTDNNQIAFQVETSSTYRAKYYCCTVFTFLLLFLEKLGSSCCQIICLHKLSINLYVVC